MNRILSRFIAIAIIAIISITFGLLIGGSLFPASAQEGTKNPGEEGNAAANAVTAPQACAIAGAIGTAPAGGNTGIFNTVRLNRNSVPSQCSNPAKPYPGTVSTNNSNRPYNVHNIINTSSSPACVTFTLTNLNGASEVFLSVHKAPFLPGDISDESSYIGDSGFGASAAGEIKTFQAVIPANTNIALVATNSSSTTTGATYRIDITSTAPGTFSACGTGSGTVSYDGPALAIPDSNPQGVNISLPVTRIGRIKGLSLLFREGETCDATAGNTNAAVDHTYLGDLRFKLTSPSGTSVTFMNRRAGARKNICSTYFQDKFNHSLISSASSNPALPITGQFQPEADGRFANFIGENADGVWTLNVSDNSSGDTGRIRRFDIIFETRELPANDLDTDGKSDVAVFRPSNGTWYFNQSFWGPYIIKFGANGDKTVNADYTGDGAPEMAVFRPSERAWYLYDPYNGTFSAFQFGLATDIPAPADYDGDGKADVAVFRPSDGTWHIQASLAGMSIVQFGANGDVPTIGDFDGDNKADIAVFRPSSGVWYRLNSSNNSVFSAQFGQNGDKVVPADYTGDGKDDIAVYRAGTWYILRSEDLSFYGAPFGLASDIPSPGDYDGDGRTDLAVYRNGQWYIQSSTDGFMSSRFGLINDVPAGSAFVY